jgi:hypothetical protein
VLVHFGVEEAVGAEGVFLKRELGPGGDGVSTKDKEAWDLEGFEGLAIRGWGGDQAHSGEEAEQVFGH